MAIDAFLVWRIVVKNAGAHWAFEQIKIGFRIGLTHANGLSKYLQLQKYTRTAVCLTPLLLLHNSPY